MSSLPRVVWICLFGYSLAATPGCTSFYALDPYLDKIVGQKVGEVSYPALGHRRLVKENGSRLTMEYSTDAMWRCRWELEIEKGGGVIKAWRYPDADAARYCRELPSSRP